MAFGASFLESFLYDLIILGADLAKIFSSSSSDLRSFNISFSKYSKPCSVSRCFLSE